uniref:ABC transporter permease n=1 Tax=uncultured Dubosiella sp. TaxID=1937011 RepID=UPI002608B821
MKILRNILGFFLSLLLLSFITFSLARMAPGDPLVSYYGERAEKMSEQEKARSRERLGLNDSLMVQYGRWLEQAARGEFGLSFKYKRPARDVMSRRIMNTFLLGGVGFVLVFVLSLAIGIFCALHEGARFDRFMIRAGTVSACIPEF